VFVLTAAALLGALGVTSLAAGWELAGVRGWVWFVVCAPELVLAGVMFMSTQVPDAERFHRLLQLSLSFVVLGNLAGLMLLVTALLTEQSTVT
jgi:hypothetical protein